jgi:hypothetical protein
MKESPVITKCEWGQIAVKGLGEFKDVKLWPGGGRAWDWSETDTHHCPGTQMADVQELLDNGAEVLVLSRGALWKLHISLDLFDTIIDKQIPVYIGETNQAVDVYNEWALDGVKVGGLFHSTC